LEKRDPVVLIVPAVLTSVMMAMLIVVVMMERWWSDGGSAGIDALTAGFQGCRPKVLPFPSAAS
jgi:hypothetical protein